MLSGLDSCPGLALASLFIMVFIPFRPLPDKSDNNVMYGSKMLTDDLLICLTQQF